MSKSSSRRSRGAPATASATLLDRDRAIRTALRTSLVSSDGQMGDSGSIWEPVTLPPDRRSHYPSPPSGLWVQTKASQPARLMSGLPARVVAPSPRRRNAPGQTSSRAFPQSSWKALLFQAPKNVQVCAQRSARKEVIHATGKAGKSTRAPKYGAYSKVRCK